MFFENSDDFLSSPKKVVSVFGMSGIGKTNLASRLMESKEWFQYSVDYRIASHYMEKDILSSLLSEIKRSGVISDLLKEEAIDLSIKIKPNNLNALSYYLGKPGSQSKGGLSVDEFMRRQVQHHTAEVSSVLDVPSFIDKAWGDHGYNNIVCDLSGSFCEIVDIHNKSDSVMNTLSRHSLILYVKHCEELRENLITNCEKNPKPIYYNKDFFKKQWDEYVKSSGVKAEDVNPNDFLAYTYRNLMKWREPRYKSIADNWGYTVEASDFRSVKNSEQFLELIANAIDSHAAVHKSVYF